MWFVCSGSVASDGDGIDGMYGQEQGKVEGDGVCDVGGGMVMR